MSKKTIETEHLLPPHVLRGISDKMYEKRKLAALEVEQTVKLLAQNSMWDKIRLLIGCLVEEYALSGHENHRKGGLLCLAAATVGLKSYIGNLKFDYLEQIIYPVSASLGDQDSRVRYYACEALFNIVKSAQVQFINDQKLFTSVFLALFKLYGDIDDNVQNAAHHLNEVLKNIATANSDFSLDNFMLVFEKCLFATNCFKRQFLLGWLVTLYNIPSLDILPHLPILLPGILKMLRDEHKEIRQAASTTLQDFLVELSNSFEDSDVNMSDLIFVLLDNCDLTDRSISLTILKWFNIIVELSLLDIIQYYTDIVKLVLKFTNHSNLEVYKEAVALNKALISIEDDTLWIEIGPEDLLNVILEELTSNHEATRHAIQALKWLEVLQKKMPQAVSNQHTVVVSALMDALITHWEKVVEASINLICLLASHENQFSNVIIAILQRFEGDDGMKLLHRSGVYIIQKICVKLTPMAFYTEMAKILQTNRFSDDFSGMMVQALNILLVTSPDIIELTHLLRKGSTSKEATDFFYILYPAWCRSTCATITICLLYQAYELSWEVLRVFSNSLSGSSTGSTVELVRLVKLIEAPAFGYLRLQLIQEERDPCLLRCMHGLLMLLPQTEAFKTLLARLKLIPDNIGKCSWRSDDSETDNRENENNKIDSINQSKLIEMFTTKQGKKGSAVMTDTKLPTSK